MVEESASVLTPPGKKMKQARLPFAPVNKQSTEGEEVQRKRKLSDAAAATPEPKTSKIEKLVEYEEVGAEYVKDSTLENNSKSISESKVGELKENVCKRTVKDKKAKPEVEVVQLDEDSVQERPETMKGRVKLAFKKNGKKEKKNSEKKADTDSDIELLTGDEREGDGEDTSMTEDWAKFHQQEMEKNPGEGHTNKIESLVTPKDEKKHKKPKPVSESTKSEEKPNLEPEPTKPETVTELKTPKGTKSSNNGAKTPKSDSKTAPKANPLAKFLVKMKPGTIPSKSKKTETAATNDDEIEIIEVKEDVEKEKKVLEKGDKKSAKIMKQKAPKNSVDEKVEEIKTDDSKPDEFETNESMSDESKTIESKIDDSTIEKLKIDDDVVAVNTSANIALVSTPVNKKVQGLKTPGGQGTPETPASIRAKKIALTKIRVKIMELNMDMEEAVKEEHFLKAHELKQKIQSLEADLEKLQKDEPGTPLSKVDSTPGSVDTPTSGPVGTPTSGSVGTPTPGPLGTPTLGSVGTPTSGSVGTPFTTPALKSKSAKKVMTSGEEVTPSSLRKLTPKQLALQEKRRKKAEEDKEEKEKKRLALKAQKEKERLEKEEEKSKEKRRKEIERIDKELQRKEKEREKEKEKKEKEVERLKKKEEKEAEQKKKDEEKTKAEEAEAERKKKAAQAFKGFFVKKDAVKEVKPTDEEKMEEVTENIFNPFQIKKNMRLAPLVRNDTVAAMGRIDSLEEPVGPDGLYVKLLRDGKHTPGKQGKTWPWEKVEEDTDIEIVEEEEEEDLENMDEGVMILQSRVGKNPRAKLIQFHENQRPAYWGTWSKQSSAVTGRKPFGRDTQVFDYEYDSDEDWEDEGEGESLSDAEDEKEEEDDYEVDNEFFVPHGYLSDEEEDKDEDEIFNPEKEKEKLKLKEKEFQADYKKKTQQLKPRLWGCYWEEDTMEEKDTNAAAQQLVKILSGYAAITCCNNNLPIATSFSQPQASPQPLAEDGGDQTRSGKGKNKVSKVFPEDALFDLVRLLHINSNNKIFLAKEFIEFWNKKCGVDAGGVDDVGGTPSTPATQLISKRRIVDKIQEIAEYKKLKGRTGRFWLVKEEIRNKVGLEQTETNTWNYILEQPNAKSSAPSEDVASSRPSSPVQSRINSPNPASLITKFTKVLTEEERAQNLSRANLTPPSAKRRKLTPSSVGQLSENPNQSKNTPVNMITVKRAQGSKPVNRIQPRKTPNTIKTTLGKSPLCVKSFALETPPKAAAPAAQNKFASAAPIAFRKAPKPKAGAQPVTTVTGAFSQLKNLQGVTVTSVGKPGDDDDCITLD